MSDRIEKQVTLRAPRARVWRAISDSQEFGRWFGVQLDGPFEPGRRIRGSFENAIDEEAILAYQRELGLEPAPVKLPENLIFCTVERVEPERYLSFRWIPFGIDATADPEREPTTLVELRLEEVEGGTRLTITESGFDAVPAHRRERAFRMNEGGWHGQAENVKRHVEGV